MQNVILGALIILEIVGALAFYFMVLIRPQSWFGRHFMGITWRAWLVWLGRLLGWVIVSLIMYVVLPNNYWLKLIGKVVTLGFETAFLLGLFLFFIRLDMRPSQHNPRVIQALSKLFGDKAEK